MPKIEHLYADQFGAFIGKHAERLRLTVKGEIVAQAPLMHLQTVTVASLGVSLSADAIAACCERGIPIYLMDETGAVYATLYSSGLVGTVLTRRAQLAAYHDERGLALARAISAGKIRNQAAALRYWAGNRQESHPDIADALTADADHLLLLAESAAALPAERLDDAREPLMGLEGAAAARYWAAAALLIPPEYGWTGRTGRGALDPINSLLNYGYGILYAEIERAIVLAGLDPYGGFLHADRPGKPSLVLDLIEEFRQIAVDRAVIGLAARHYRVEQSSDGKLTAETRRDFAKRIIETLDAPIRTPEGRIALRHLIQRQARELAAFLRGDRAVYAPFDSPVR